MWDTVKAVLRREFIVLNAYIQQEDSSQVNILSSCLKKLEKEEQNKTKARRKEINRKTIEESVGKKLALQRKKSIMFISL